MTEVQKIYPLIIKDAENSIIDVSLSNEKAFNKSLERRILWHLHTDTGRLLPYNESLPLISITKHHSWYEAALRKEVTGPKKEPAQRELSPSDTYSYDENKTTVLHLLEQIIRERKQTLPEGSYTTHLFTSGSEKIRKKTGEEAVELILASDPDAMIYEAADLIYHMMVLLVSENISIDSVLQELAGRFT